MATKLIKYSRLAAFGLLATYYIFLIGVDLDTKRFCNSTGIDFCAYWSSGKIANEAGIAQVYDIDSLKEFQEPIYPKPFPNNDFFLVIPFPYLPIFVIPFQAFALLPIKVGYFIWNFLNFILLFWYLHFFTLQVSGEKIKLETLFIVFFSMPFFLNIQFGQLNILLGIAAGEFFRNSQKGRPFLAGSWLAGLLLKPQTLVLILPYLVWKKDWRSLFGFSSIGLLLVGISAILAGPVGIDGFINILTGSSTGRSASNPLLMMNWRMFSLHFDNFLGTSIHYWISIIGALGTLWLVHKILAKLHRPNPNTDLLSIFSIFIATMLVTWHAHFSQILTAIPFLAILINNGLMPNKLKWSWFSVPILVAIFSLFTVVTLNLIDAQPVQVNVLKFFGGFRGFIFNLVFLFWAYNTASKQPNPATLRPNLTEHA